ncbi:hypothetical protein TWF730_001943 [Orbilia blumenaviensis]|uniref:Uncharacterized protein n=1 Tax=Orbilia blumenaviensis TaxID=1796055 RepID=A0AAV9UCH4_9PEZI
MSGGIKSTCQVCLKPKCGIERKDWGRLKTVCVRCVDENIILADVVRKIPNLDVTKFYSFHAMCGYELARMGPGPSRPYQKVCYWRPDVQREVELLHNAQWKDVSAKHPYFDDIRPLATPKETRDYYDAVSKKIFNSIVAEYRRYLEPEISHLISLNNLKLFWESERKRRQLRSFGLRGQQKPHLALFLAKNDKRKVILLTYGLIIPLPKDGHGFTRL